MTRPRPRTGRRAGVVVAAFVGGALLTGIAGLLSGCTDEGDDADDAASRQVTDPDELTWTSCEHLEEGFRLEHPEGWAVDGSEGDCTAFDPDGDPGSPAIRLRALDEPLATVADGQEDDATLIDGRRAMRLATNEEDGTRWLLDLRNGRTLEATAQGSPALDADAFGQVLDRMVEDLRWVDPRASGEGLEPVGAPVTDTVEGRPDLPDEAPRRVTDLRAAAQDGFDRVVIELGGDGEPAYSVTPREELPVVDAAGIPVEGDHFLDARIPAATLFDGDGTRTYEGPARVPAAGGDVVAEAVLVPSPDDELRLVVGLQRPAAFAVAVIPEPTRLVIDVVHDPVAGDEP